MRRLFRCSAGERSVMAHWKPVDLVQDLVNQLGGEERIKRIQSGELVFVERNAQAVVASGDNGGISPYISAPLLNVESFIADWREFYRLHSMKANPPSLKSLGRAGRLLKNIWSNKNPHGTNSERIRR